MKRVSSPLKCRPFRIRCFWRVLLWVVQEPVLLSGENGVQHIGLSSLVMMEPILYGGCSLSETERRSCKMGDGGAVESQWWQLYSQWPISTLIWVYGLPWYQGEQHYFSASRREMCVSLTPKVSNPNHLVNKTVNIQTLLVTFATKWTLGDGLQAGVGWGGRSFFMTSLHLYHGEM